MHKFFLFSLVTLVLSCTEAKNYDKAQKFSYDDFNKIVSLYADSLAVNALNAVDLTYIDNYLVVLNRNTDTLLNIYDDKYNLVSRFIPKGQGPGELLANMRMRYKVNMNSLTIFDPIQKKLVHYQYKEMHEKPELKFIRDIKFQAQGLYNVAAISHNKYIALTVGDDRYVTSQKDISINHKRLLTYNNSGKLSRAYGNFPTYKEKYNAKEKPDIFKATLSTKPTEDKLVLAYKYTDLIEIYTGNKLAVRLHGPKQFFPSFSKSSEGKLPKPNENCGKAYYDICSSEKGIYLLFASPETLNSYQADLYNRVLFLNWQGEPIHLYNLDVDLFSITAHKNVLYGIGRETRTIYQFALPEKEK